MPRWCRVQVYSLEFNDKYDVDELSEDKPYPQKMFSILGSPEEYRLPPTVSGEKWIDEAEHTRWFVPGISLVAPHEFGALLQFMFQIAGFCVLSVGTESQSPSTPLR